MARDLFNRYIWLVDTIYRAGTITLEEINRKWVRSSMSDGNPIPNRTFHNHRKAIEAIFDINIDCNPTTYRYSIDNADDMARGGVRQWLINTFAVNNLINESHKLKQRILFEHIPSGQHHLTPIIEAMRDGLSLEVTYQSYWLDSETTFEVKPYFVKVFKQRWYLIGQSDKMRIYALDRIQNLHSTDTHFELPEGFDPEAFFYNCYGIIQGEDKKPQEVTLKVDADQVKYIRALPLHHSQKETETTDDYSVFTYYIKPTFDFRQELLSHGETVEVLTPDWFRKEMKEITNNMNVRYGGR